MKTCHKLIITLFCAVSWAHAAALPLLKKPAQRIITLAPNLTELVFAANLQNRLVGVSRFSDYPAAAQSLPVVGDAFSMSLESIVKLKPDLILTWQDGTRAADLAKLRQLKIPVWEVSVTRLEDISLRLRELAKLTKTSETLQIVSQIENRLNVLKNLPPLAKRPRVFMQLSEKPIYTVGQKQILNQVISLCGGDNIFANQTLAAPQVTLESVIRYRPEIMVFATKQTLAEVSQPWQNWPQIPAVIHEAFINLPADAAARPGIRTLDAAEALCADLRKPNKTN